MTSQRSLTLWLLGLVVCCAGEKRTRWSARASEHRRDSARSVPLLDALELRWSALRAVSPVLLGKGGAGVCVPPASAALRALTSSPPSLLRMRAHTNNTQPVAPQAAKAQPKPRPNCLQALISRNATYSSILAALNQPTAAGIKALVSSPNFSGTAFVTSNAVRQRVLFLPGARVLIRRVARARASRIDDDDGAR